MKNNAAAKWIEGQHYCTRCSLLGAKVALILGAMSGGGIYNAPVRFEKVDWVGSHHIEVVWSGSLASWDGMPLSSLWVLANRLMLRVEMEAATVGRLRLTFYPRHTREGSVYERLPSCESLIAEVDQWLNGVDIKEVDVNGD